MTPWSDVSLLILSLLTRLKGVAIFRKSDNSLSSAPPNSSLSEPGPTSS